MQLINNHIIIIKHKIIKRLNQHLELSTTSEKNDKSPII